MEIRVRAHLAHNASSFSGDSTVEIVLPMPEVDPSEDAPGHAETLKGLTELVKEMEKDMADWVTKQVQERTARASQAKVDAMGAK